ncbi:ABC transporter ATP-binding protein [Candidatus Calescamantes bacterium]|nr:ABC transporter ATP-binding protein [Candidatus Calescamantes bacterium]
MSKPLLKIEDLWIVCENAPLPYPLLKGINLEIYSGEKVGIVGESGCGKTLTALSILNILPEGIKIEKGKIILFHNQATVSLHSLPQNSPQWLKIRGEIISMIFQEPSVYLNPTLPVGFQIMEPLIYHSRKLTREQQKRKAIEFMGKVGLPHPESLFHRFPHELSGGMKQRVLIAMALILHPKLLIADEPTTALDVTIQANILKLLLSLSQELKMSLLLITHDLSIIAETVDKLYVMYAGEMVEWGKTEDLLKSPLHPYLSSLINALPVLEREKKVLKPLPGTLPDPREKIKGCPFYPRCGKKLAKCKEIPPPSIKIDENHWVKCWMYENP